MRLLITGGAGFIGSNLALRCQELFPSWKIHILDNLATGNPDNLKEFQGEFITGDVCDKGLVDNLVSRSDAVVHLAALGSVPRSIANPEKTFRSNVLGTESVLSSLSRHKDKRLIFASSSSVYGGNPSQPKRETDYTIPLSPYAASKAAGEALIAGYSSAFEFGATVFRFFNVYGPRQSPEGEYAAVIPKFLSAALAGEGLEIYGDGSKTRDFTYVQDVVDAIIFGLEESERLPNRILNLAQGRPVSVARLAELVANLTRRGSSLPVTYFEPRVGDPSHSESDPTLLMKAFPRLQFTSLEKGLEETIRWMENERD